MVGAVLGGDGIVLELREGSDLVAEIILLLSRNWADGILTGHDPWLLLRVMRIEALCLRH